MKVSKAFLRIKISLILEIFKYFLPLAVVVTALCLLVYAAVQQDIRQGANDPQIQIAEDLAENLSAGQPVSQAVPPYNIDIAKSLTPYAIVFDESGKPVASSVQLDGKTPEVPDGVFNYVKNHGEDRFTWQPKPGVRSAVVVTKFKDGFVLVGRSMREIEKREERTFKMVGLAWLVTLASTFVVTAFLFLIIPKLKFSK